MKQFNTGVAELVFVSVPKDAYDFRFDIYKHLNYQLEDKRIFVNFELNRPEIISLLSSITEEQCNGLVIGDIANPFQSDKENIQKAIEASGIEQDQNSDILILKVLKQ